MQVHSEFGSSINTKVHCDFAIVAQMFDASETTWRSLVKCPWIFALDVVVPQSDASPTTLHLQASNTLVVALVDVHIRQLLDAVDGWRACDEPFAATTRGRPRSQRQQQPQHDVTAQQQQPPRPRRRSGSVDGSDPVTTVNRASAGVPPVKFVADVVLPGAELELATEHVQGQGHYVSATGVATGMELLVRLFLGATTVSHRDAADKTTTTISISHLRVLDCLQKAESPFAMLLTTVDVPADGSDDHDTVAACDVVIGGVDSDAASPSKGGSPISITLVSRTEAQVIALASSSASAAPDVPAATPWDSETHVVLPHIALQWNPATIKALQIFLYQQRNDANASPVPDAAPPPTVDVPAHCLVPISLDGDGDTAAAGGSTVRYPLSTVVVSVGRFDMRMNKNEEHRTIGLLSATGLRVHLSDAPVAAPGCPPDFDISGGLASLVVRDVGHAGAAMPEVLVVTERHSGQDAQPSMSWRVQSFRRPSTPALLDSLISTHLSNVRVVFVNQTWLELIGTAG